MHDVPQLGRSCASLQNCDYVNQCGWCKDCYHIFEADYDESCYYSNNLWQSRSCMDMLQCFKCELCYECTDCRKCYGLRYSERCENCHDSSFLYGCIGCKNCIGCVNLRNKEYYIFNERCTKEEFQEKKKALELDRRKNIVQLQSQFAAYALQFPRKCLLGSQNEDSTGDALFHTQRCADCFDLTQCQDCKNLYQSRCMRKVHDVMNFGAEGGAEYCYECHELGDGVRNILFSDQIWTSSHDIIYCKLCVNGSHDLFGCVGMKHAAYCVFNKQYTKEEYEALVPKIIKHMQTTGEWGEFFPSVLSPFAYNETLAQQFFPLEREDAIQKEYRWKDDIDEAPEVPKIISGEQLPETIDEVPDEVLEWAIQCPVTARPFRIVKQEIDFYRNQRISVPQVHPDERHRRRLQKRNPQKLWSRNCMKCQKDIKTSYAPDCSEIVYCEECYLQSVY